MKIMTNDKKNLPKQFTWLNRIALRITGSVQMIYFLRYTSYQIVTGDHQFGTVTGRSRLAF